MARRAPDGIAEAAPAACQPHDESAMAEGSAKEPLPPWLSQPTTCMFNDVADMQSALSCPCLLLRALHQLDLVPWQIP